MDDNKTMYCKIYVDSDMNEDQLMGLITRITSGSVISRISTVSTEDFNIYIDSNEDFDESRRLRGQDQFLFYRYYLDIDPTDNATQVRYIESVSNLLQGLWLSGCKAVASCDFESKLPRSGGYQASSVD